ncbi:MAG TPA: tripartite tricarboxylate transporter substrate-binding protein [Xanthobacteraceae bacterium]
MTLKVRSTSTRSSSVRRASHSENRFSYTSAWPVLLTPGSGTGWVGMFVPAGTPKDIVALLHGGVANIMALADVREQLSSLGFNPLANTPEQFDAQLRFELEKWGKVIRAANLRAQ